MRTVLQDADVRRSMSEQAIDIEAWSFVLRSHTACTILLLVSLSVIDPSDITAARAPDGFELAALLSALQAQRHPALARFDNDQAALEFLLDDCCIAVFERVADGDDGDSGTVLLMVMDSGPEYVSSARFDGVHANSLAHTTLGDFMPYEEFSQRPSKLPPRVLPESASGPRAPDEDELRDFLRMFRAVEEPFIMELSNDAARLAYLREAARIALFDRCKSGAYAGPLAFFLWPTGPRFVTVAIRSSGRWRFAGGELIAD